MAVTTSAGAPLPVEVVDTIIQKTQEQSAIMAAAVNQPVSATTNEFPVITGDPDAFWTNEAAEKTVDEPTVGTKTLRIYKLAVIVPFSEEVESDQSSLFNALVDRIPAALGKKFDRTVYGYETAPGSDFDQFSASPAIGYGSSAYDGIIATDSAIADADGTLNRFIASPKLRNKLMTEKDNENRPLFVTSIADPNAFGTILGAPVQLSKNVYNAGTPNTLGVAGDFTHARYAVLNGIRVDRSTEASLNLGSATPISLFQNDLIAIRAEIRVGFILDDADYFVRITDAKAES
jgi:HK97 family phage major capsid protein